MVIYADILFITNLYIDFFLLVCVKNLLHLQTGALRLLLGALAGAACSMTALLPSMQTPLSVVLGIAAALAVTAAAFAPVKWQMYLKISVSYWISSFLFAGFFMLIYNFFAPRNLAVISGVVYLDISAAMLFGMTVFAYIVLSLLQKIVGTRESSMRFCRLIISNNGKTVNIHAKADTGNSLCEPFSGLPIIVAEESAVSNVMPDSIKNFLQNADVDGTIRLVPFNGMGGSGVLPAFMAEKVCFDKTNTPIKCYIAVCTQKLSSGQFQAIFNPDLLETQLLSGKTKTKEHSAEDGSLLQ